MKAVDVGAAPQTAEPTSNSVMLDSSTALTDQNVYSLPNESWNAHDVSRYALPYHPTSSRELKSSVIFGMAFAGQQTSSIN